MTKTAVVSGATGLVGQALTLDLLADREFSKVRILVRRKLPLDSPKLEQILTDFSDLESLGSALRADAWFCCLGTTQAKAGSREAFRRVDFDLPLGLARIAAEAGTQSAFVVSSLGADPHSRVFYSRTKGELEAALSDLPFCSLGILRPSILLGARPEFRLGERIGIFIAQCAGLFLLGPLAKYRAIPAHVVAKAMVRLAKNPQPGTQILESDRIAVLGAA